MVPRAVAHFDVVGPLGEGGMGVVYRAHDRVLERDVALKLIRADRAGDATTRERFLREARAAATLNHPGIATVYEAGEAPAPEEGEPPLLYIATELVEGETLAARARRGPLPVDDVIRIGLQAAEALAEAHDHGLVHRDIKPSNLMLTVDERVKVLDFGLAKQRAWLGGLASAELDAVTQAQTRPGLLVGTPAYMAPEQITGERVDARADVYALGGVLYELLSGAPPFSAPDTSELLRRRLTETPPPIGERRPEVPEGLAAVIDRAMERDARRRYPDAREMAEALRSPGPATVTRVGRVRRSRHPGRVLRGAGLALAVAAVGAALWLTSRPDAPPALAFGERDFVLVADVVNQTGEPVFDVALKSALETDLRQSRYVNALEPARVQNTLRMMRLDPETRIDDKVGRDVCRRAGAKALVAPTILRVGEAYQLQAALIEPSTARVVDEVRRTAHGREEVLLSTIDELTRDLRRRLGESLASIARTDPPFAEYTTSSLEALQMLETGTRAWGAGDHAAAERAFREALDHDPHFATARGALGLLLIQFMGRPREGRALIAQALEEGGETSQREHLHLKAVYEQFVTGDLERALDDYRFVAELYPDYVVPYNNAGRIFLEQGRDEEARDMFERAHRVDPQSPVPLWNLWPLELNRLHDPESAERRARDLVALLPDNAVALHCVAWTLVAERRFEQAESTLRAVLELDPHHPFALPNLGHLLMRRGAAEEAVELYRRTRDQARQSGDESSGGHIELCLGLALEAAGREAESRQLLLATERQVRARSSSTPLDAALRAALLAAAGRPDTARTLLESATPPKETTPNHHLWLARARLALGERSRALTEIERAFARGYSDPYYLLVDPTLAAVRDDPVVSRLAPAERVTADRGDSSRPPPSGRP